MARFRLSIRWWLALAFALIAAVTAFAVATVFSTRANALSRLVTIRFSSRRSFGSCLSLSIAA